MPSVEIIISVYTIFLLAMYVIYFGYFFVNIHLRKNILVKGYLELIVFLYNVIYIEIYCYFILFFFIFLYKICSEMIQLLNINKNVAYLGKWCFSPLQSTVLETSFIYARVSL